MPDGQLTKIPQQPKCNGTAARSESLKSLVRSIFQNKPLVIFLAVFLFEALGMGMWLGLVFIYVDVYLGMGDLFAQMFLVSFIAGMVITPLWYKVAAILGKRNTWFIGMFLLMASFLYTGFLEPGEDSFSKLMGLKLINTLGLVSVNIMSLSLLSDVADYGAWKFKTNVAGTYFSIKLFFEKF